MNLWEMRLYITHKLNIIIIIIKGERSEREDGGDFLLRHLQARVA